MKTNLPVTQTQLVVYEGTGEVEKDLRTELDTNEEIERLQSDIAHMSAKVVEATILVGRLESEISTIFKAELEEVKELEELADALTEELTDAEDDGTREEDEDANPFDDGEDRADSEVTEEEEAEGEKLLKSYYRLISMMCHPDRTKLKSLHALFNVANEAYRLKNLDKLRDLYAEVQDVIRYGSGLMARLMARIARLKAELEGRIAEYKEITESEDYATATIYFKDVRSKMNCLNNMSSNLRSKKYQLQHEIAVMQELKRQRDNPKPPAEELGGVKQLEDNGFFSRFFDVED